MPVGFPDYSILVSIWQRENKTGQEAPKGLNPCHEMWLCRLQEASLVKGKGSLGAFVVAVFVVVFKIKSVVCSWSSCVQCCPGPLEMENVWDHAVTSAKSLAG